MERLPPPEDPVDRPTPRRLSQIFRELAGEATAPVSVGRIREAMGDRSFAALLILFSIFNLLPLPPGSTLVFGVPLILVSVQMVLGYTSAWLPQRVLDKSISPERFRSSADKMIPRLERLEDVIRPRYWPFTNGNADRIIGLVTLVLAIAVFLPIPLGNWLPAFATLLIGVAMCERDGVLLAAGTALGIISLAIIGAVVGAAGVLAGAVFGFSY